jgi:hypothetical protein
MVDEAEEDWGKRNGNNGYRERLSKKQRWLSKK